VERPPEIAHVGVVADLSRAEQRAMPIGERAGGAVAGQFVAKPLALRRARPRRRFAVERQHAPGSNREAVPAESGGSGAAAEVIEVRPAGALLFLDDRPRPR